MTLAEFQEAFSNALLQAQVEPRALKAIPLMESSELGRLQFAAQRDRLFREWTESLAEIYPTVHQVLGAKTFTEVATEYLIKHPPQSAHPVEALEMFPFFLESQAKARAFPFLPDVATMDLGYQKSYHAIDTETVRTSAFTEMSPEALAGKRIQLHPACFWFSSSFAIHDIWRLHHSRVPPKNVDYHWPQDVIILRPHLTVEIHKIDLGFTNALDRLDAGETMESAFTRANQMDNKFKPVAALQFLIQNNLIVSLY